MGATSIIVFTNGSAKEVEKRITEAFSEANLKINPLKRKALTCSSEQRLADEQYEHFDYLGYRLSFRHFLHARDDWREVNVGISRSKIRKLKTRIACAFVAFTKDRDIELLDRRLRFICGNHLLKRNENGALYGGLYYNYQHLSDMTDLDDLTKFMRTLIFARRGSIGKKINGTLTIAQRRRLARLDFRTAFERRLGHKFSRNEMQNLRRCWLYEKN